MVTSRNRWLFSTNEDYDLVVLVYVGTVDICSSHTKIVEGELLEEFQLFKKFIVLMENKALSYESRNWLNCVKQTKIHSCFSPVRHKPRILIEYFRL